MKNVVWLKNENKILAPVKTEKINENKKYYNFLNFNANIVGQKNLL